MIVYQAEPDGCFECSCVEIFLNNICVSFPTLSNANIIYSKVLYIDASQDVQDGIMDGSAAFERCFIDNKFPISC